LTPAIVLQLSLLATDAQGRTPTYALPSAAPIEIAAECTRSPLYVNPAVPGELMCGALYVLHSLRESGWKFIDGDGGRAHGPFQVWGRPPRDWRDAVLQFSPILKRASVCAEPLEMLATGKCGTDVGARISKSRTDAATRMVLAWMQNPDTVCP
jgi:hypothetical protein